MAAFIPPIGSTVAFQSDPTKLVGTVSVIGTFNSSVTTFQGTSPWIVNQPSPSIIAYQVAGSVLAVSGSFSSTPQSSINALQLAGSILAVRTDNASVVAVLSNSSVAVLQGTDPWKVNVPTPSYISYQLAGSVMAVNATVNTGNSSVQLLGGVAAIGSVAVLQGTNPWQVNVPSPSMITYQLAGSVLAVSATVNTGNSSVQLLGGVAVIGSVATLQGTNPWVISNPSVTAFQGGAWSTSMVGAINVSGSVLIQGGSNSIITAPQPASVLAFQGTLPWVIQSIVGTYAEDSAATSADKGLFVLGVRNDTLSSMTSADLDYSSHIVGPAGEMITANAPLTKWIQADASIMANVSVQAVAAQGASIFTYITGVQVANVSPNNVYVTFTGGLGGKSSVLGYSPAPANGGAIISIPNAWKTGANMGVSASVSGMGSIFLSMQGFISKT